MKKYIDLFVSAIESHDTDILPMAPRYRATENAIPAAICFMETFNCFDKVNCIGIILEDKVLNTFFISLSAAYGKREVAINARVKVEDGLFSEVEIEVYHGRVSTGFWFAPQDMPQLESLFNSQISSSRIL